MSSFAQVGLQMGLDFRCQKTRAACRERMCHVVVSLTLKISVTYLSVLFQMKSTVYCSMRNTIMIYEVVVRR